MISKITTHWVTWLILFAFDILVLFLNAAAGHSVVVVFLAFATIVSGGMLYWSLTRKRLDEDGWPGL